MGHFRQCPNGCGQEIRHLMDPETHELTPYDPYHFEYACPGSYESGAAVAFGIIGMGEAIRDWHQSTAAERLFRRAHELMPALFRGDE